MDYISVKEAANKWGISERRVRALCESGRIEGVSRCGDWVWSIPATTPRPVDGRTLRYMKNRSLRTGSQDYSTADKIRKTSKKNPISDNSKAEIIFDSFLYTNSNISLEQINEILKLNNQNLDLSLQVKVLNMKNSFSLLSSDMTEGAVSAVNKRILMNINEIDGGNYRENGMEELQAILSQYVGSWSILHPVAKAAFLFSELLRTKPYKSANEETAFIILSGELAKAGLPPVIFGKEKIQELKAALSSAEIRGNNQELIALLLGNFAQSFSRE